MRYFVLACDYDGTIARGGVVDHSTQGALEEVRQSGRKLILVTGRKLDDLLTVFPEAILFDRIVAENGAVLYHPEKREEKALAEPPSPKLLEDLRARRITPLSVGKSIISTWEPNQAAVMDALRNAGLELNVIFNKGALMILPSGINKESGLKEALRDLNLSEHNAVGVGDAENDHAFLSICEFSAAVANAVPTIKERVDYVTSFEHGEGVEELIRELLASDLASFEQRSRRRVRLGTDMAENEVSLPVYGAQVLIIGQSGGGKSTIAAAILERLAKSGYQFCIIDPEGDYDAFEHAITLGDQDHAPAADEMIQVLNKLENAVVDLIGISVSNRNAVALQLIQKLGELCKSTGRPHWLIFDEAHQMLPKAGDPVSGSFPKVFGSEIFITVHPKEMSREILASINVVIAVGSLPAQTMAEFSAAVGRPAPPIPEMEEGLGALVWFCSESGPPTRLRIEQAETERRRHRRNYASGNIHEKSFFFRGPEGKLNLRAQNLISFLQIAEGVDDETWIFHLRRGDYSQWIRTAIKDEVLAQQVSDAECNTKSPAEARAQIKAAIENLYTGPV